MAATMTLVRAQPASTGKVARGGRGRGRKRGITAKEMGAGALGVIAGGAMTAGLFRLGVPPMVAAGATVGVGAVGAAMTANTTRTFFVGHAAGGAALLTASFAGAFKPRPAKKDEAKDPKAKALDAGAGSEVVPTAPTTARDANPPRNSATLADQMRTQIADAMRRSRERQAA